ncbi:MAG: hypothetical protein J6X85_09475 [Ruminococcus sp.]|uniref:hypothetical protein n=1 Tax=Ruminococcus sp. TaxID=41978 RepID=UPI001B74DC07|nr:hypothetical protein [Ruminococcus sp.]MBP5430791.1 hypothetical protein [Ruminococcus sp.]MBP5581996.1 hypothetical protein [Ruminococcus sp.]
MAAEYLANAEQLVTLNSPINFTASIPCRRGFIYHEDETGIFILRGITDQCFATYQVTFNGNIALPEDAEDVVPIAIAITVNGEPRPTSRAIFTPAAVDEFGNVTSTAIIRVPKGCCFSLSVEAVPATTDPTVTPAPVINVQNANLVINRIA